MNNLPKGAIEGYEGSEDEQMDFIGVLVGAYAPVRMIEKLRGTDEAIEVAKGCVCEHCDEFLAERGVERDPVDPTGEEFQA